MLEEIIQNQAAFAPKMDDIKSEIFTMSAKTDRIQGPFDAFDAMNSRIGKLESIVQQQAAKLVDYENRSRRNNLLVFGVTETETDSREETEPKLKNLSWRTYLRKPWVYRFKQSSEFIALVDPKQKKCRPVILKFFDAREKESALKKGAKLKGTPWRVCPEFAKETVDVRRKLWESAAQTGP